MEFHGRQRTRDPHTPTLDQDFDERFYGNYLLSTVKVNLSFVDVWSSDVVPIGLSCVVD